jgi:hypothetical protein
MIRGSVGLSDGYEDAYSKGLAKRASAPVYSVGAVVSADLQWLSDVEGIG